MQQVQQTLNMRGTLLSVHEPVVMGILNATPDSFYSGSRIEQIDAAIQRCGMMLNDGAQIIDIGGISTRPQAKEITLEEESARVIPLLSEMSRTFPNAHFSIDTFRSEIAQKAINAGASMVNDIYAGRYDEKIIEVATSHSVPYVAMHMLGTPQSMQEDPEYDDVTRQILHFFIDRMKIFRKAGLKDVIVDPGFGFGKTVAHNYELLRKLGVFKILGLPIMIGASRKSMICKVLGVNPKDALNGTTAVHILALQNGAKILRAHDVNEAMGAVRIWKAYESGK